jgi:hypothetical protein
MHEASDAAKRGNFRDTDRNAYYLTGPAVFLGESDACGAQTEYTDVPQSLIDHFGAVRDMGAEQ